MFGGTLRIIIEKRVQKSESLINANIARLVKDACASFANLVSISMATSTE